MRIWIIAMVFGFFAGLGQSHAANTTAHAFSFGGIDGGEVRLADFAGRPILVVNTASRCGFTPQYDGLQALWDKYRDQGLVVIGVPSDNFNQELATEADVKEFCEVNFSINFPMTTIENVRGAQAHPFFAWTASQKGAPKWNFYKYLVAPDGTLADWYGSSVRPSNPRLTGKIEAFLAQR